MKKILLVFLLLASAAQAQDINRNIDAVLASYATPATPGVAVGVIKDGKPVYEGYAGMADMASGTPAGKETLFYLASVSKQFTAACVVLLEQKGKLSLNDNLAKYFPEFPAYAKNITLKHLLNHTSGLKDYPAIGWLKGLEDNQYTSTDVVKWLAALEPDFAPGSKVSYSNSGYFLLIQIVQKVTGMSINEFAAKNLFGPLGMKDTRYSTDAEANFKNKAKAYVSGDNGYKAVTVASKVIGGGGIYSTIADMQKWLLEVDSKKVFGTKFWDIMLNADRAAYSSKTAYSKGFFIWKDKYGKDKIGHGGDVDGYHTYSTLFPTEHIGMVVLSNNDNIDVQEINAKVFDLLFGREPEGAAVVETPKQETITLPEEKLKQYAGKYPLAPGAVVTVSVEKGKLHILQGWDQNKYPVEAINEDTFILPVMAGVSFRFTDIKDGKAQNLVLTQAGEQQVVARNDSSAAVPLYTSYTGTFYSKDLDKTYTLYEEDGTLKCKISDSYIYAITPAEGEAFSMQGMDVTFKKDKDIVTGFTLSHGRAANLQFVRQ